MLTASAAGPPKAACTTIVAPNEATEINALFPTVCSASLVVTPFLLNLTN